MMKKWLILIAAYAVCFGGYAESNLSMENRAVLRNREMIKKMPQLTGKQQVKISERFSYNVTGLIRLKDGASAESLREEGVNVVRVRGNIAMVVIPANDVERVAQLKSVDKLHLSRQMKTKMNEARKAVGADKIHFGTDLSQPYTGDGVIVGIVDGGIEPNHLNFKKDDGSSRFSHFTHIYIDENSSDGFSVDNYSDRIAEFTTDDPGEYHGTHTTGIMAGGYKGLLTASTLNDDETVDVGEIPNPYYGMAPDAEIAASCGDMSEMLVALGIEGIIEHAKEEGKPVAINLSLGSNLGPHDGSDVMNEYLELAGEEALICVAAGNEGTLPIAISQRFTNTDKELKTFIQPMVELSGYNNFRYGQVYVYSEDDTEFVIKAVIYNKKRGTYTFMLPIETNTEGVPVYYASENYLQDGDNTSAAFSKAFEGYLGMGSMIDENNGRYYALIDYMLWDNIEENADGNYMLGFVIDGKEGSRVDCYGDGLYTCFDGYGQPDWDNGSTDGSINNHATGRNIIVVGSYNNRPEWASLDGEVYTYGSQYAKGQVSSFSSYGTLIDGRKLPHVCAPGMAVISSSSTACVDGYDMSEAELEALLQGKATVENQQYYWHQQIGTSMSTPVVTGAMALWLEADPSLTVDEALDIIQSTSVKDSDVTDYTGSSVQWGAGKFDAYNGLKEVIRRYEAGVENNLLSDEKIIITGNGNDVYEVFVSGASKVGATLYDLAGKISMTSQPDGNQISLDTSALAPGIYILNVNNRHSKRILVK